MSNIKSTAVKLAKTNSYNTYQLYCEMLNNNTNLENGLKIAILSTYSWLRERLKDIGIPKELDFPSEDSFSRVKNEDLKSFTIGDGYSINVVCNVEEGIFALKMTETDSGTLSEDKNAVAGRTITSDIAYRIVSDRLECGFKTTVTDTKEVEKAKCIRFGLVKKLASNQNFGIKQITNLYEFKDLDIDNDLALQNFKTIINSNTNELPVIIYPYDDYKDIGKIDDIGFIPKLSIPNIPVEKTSVKDKKDAYVNRYCGIARLYFLPSSMFQSVVTTINRVSIDTKEIIIVEPKKFGGKTITKHYEDKTVYQDILYNYTRDKELDFKDILFYNEARLLLLSKQTSENEETIKLLNEASETIEILKNKFEKQERLEDYKNISSNKIDTKKLEDINKRLLEEQSKNIVLEREIIRLSKELEEKKEYIGFLERKDNRPKKHKDIANWCRNFKYVELHQKATDCLNRNDAENVDVDKICDAIDYLENAYSLKLFGYIDDEELMEISYKLYKRPYNVTPSGIPTSAKGDCKIKVAINGEKRREYPLDQHLKIGSHGELLRIYFLIDKNNEKIIIGSLPNHLEY